MAAVIAALLPVFLLIVLGFLLKRTLLRPETQSVLSPDLRKVLALDDERNDKLSASMERRSGFLK